MNYLISLLGYGDNLITGSILENKLTDPKILRIVGSGVTQRVWSLLKKPINVDTILFDEVPAIYTLRERGLLAALRDASVFRSWANKTLTDNDTVIFESASSYRNQWLLGKNICRRAETHRVTNAYTDRALVIGNIVGSHVWIDAEPPCNVANEILINPNARSKDRTISPQVVGQIITSAKSININVSLIDIHGNLAAYSAQVNHYILNPTLDEAVIALRRVDRYIGPDSFFMHLAYYYRIPQLALFWKRDVYFQPPGLMKQGGIFYFDDISNVVNIKSRLLGFMLGNTDHKSTSY